MNEQSAILLLIAGYLRKLNHPEETPEVISANVNLDLALVVDAIQDSDSDLVAKKPTPPPLPNA